MSIQDAKKDLRKEMRLILNGIADSVSVKSAAIREHLTTIDAFCIARQSERLMSFVSMPLEVDTAPLFSGHSMIVPYCDQKEIIPVRIVSPDELEPSGSMNLLEPKLSVLRMGARQVLSEHIDVVLVPGLAFDRHGHRLGRGKGFYDRFLRRLPAKTLTIGLAFGEMMRVHVPHDENDVPVNQVVTEEGMVAQ